MEQPIIDPDLLPTGTFKQRVLGMVADTVIWDMNFLKRAFPQTHEKQLYRAIKELLNDGSIRFVGQTGRVKSYTTIGLSALPAIKNKEGEWFDLKDLFPAIPSHYTNGRWHKTDEINELFLSLGQLFLVAELDEPDMTKQYRELIFKFFMIKQSLTEMTVIVDTVINHPTMGQDPKLFKRIFAGNAPDQETKNNFKLWLSQFIKDKNANEALAKSNPPASDAAPGN